MKAILPRSLSPLDIAKRSGIAALSVCTPALLTGVAPVTKVANLANGDTPWVQSVAANQGDQVASAILGRNTLSFNAAKSRYYTY
jgi:hypothetical protein